MSDIPKTRRKRTFLVIGTAVVVAAAALTYQLTVARHRAPSFSQGGTFVDGSKFPRVGTNNRPVPYGDASSARAETTTTTRANVTTAAAPTKPSAAASPPASVLASTSAPVAPATGLYHYTVDGSERVTGFGSRDFPDTMSMAVHTDPNQGARRVLDLRFSENHEEREILNFGADGVAFTYEAGSITFGPSTQTSEGTYDPPMIQVPWPLVVGTKVAKTSPVKSNSGDTSRTEKWTTTIIGRETIPVLGSPHDTWVVEIQRNTTPGGKEQVDRYRKYWYDPSLGIWVKWVERFKGERNMGFTFTYSADYTATLKDFSASA